MSPENFQLKYILFLIGSLIFALLMNSLMLRFIKTLGMRNNAETVIRWSKESKPAIGGITFYILFLLSGAVYPLFFGNTEIVYSAKSLGILTATSLGFLMGLADDAYNTKPVLKSATQLLCAAILIYTGTQINVFENDYLNKLLTVFWVVGIMNSLNMLDNMDGITGVVSLFIGVSIILMSIANDLTSNMNFIIISGVTTSAMAFLYYNWHPSKMYMGDSGSQFLGIVLSALGIIYFWNPIGSEGESISISKHLLLPLIAFLLPIVDTTTVTINRISKGQSPFVGGKDHTTHYLSRTGLGDKKVAYVVGLIAFISAISVYIITTGIKEWKFLYFLIFLGYSILIFAILFLLTKKKYNKKEEKLEE